MNIKLCEWPRFLLEIEDLGLKTPEEVTSEYDPGSKNTLGLHRWDQWTSETNPEVYRDIFFYP